MRVRLAQIGMAYQVPGASYSGEMPAVDLIVEFTRDESAAAEINQEAMQWVQQRNVLGLVERATRVASLNPEQARKTLELARSMTKRLGNQVMTVALDRAVNELASNRTISPGTSKTLRIGAKTQTVRVASDQEGLSEEEIRKVTGV